MSQDTPTSEKTEHTPETAASVEEPSVRPFYRRPLWWLLGLPLFLLFLVVVVFGTGYGLLQITGIQDWVRGKVNAALANPGGMSVELTELSGSIPLAPRLGLKISDARGVWLEVPSLMVTLDYASSPGEIGLSLMLEDGHILRVPESTGEQPAPPPSEPMTTANLRELLKSIAQSTEGFPKWFPSFVIRDIAINRFRVDRDVYCPPDQASEILGRAAQEHNGESPSPIAPLAEALVLSLKGNGSLGPVREEERLPSASWSNPALGLRLHLLVAPVGIHGLSDKEKNPDAVVGAKDGGASDRRLFTLLPGVLIGENAFLDVIVSGALSDPVAGVCFGLDSVQSKGITADSVKFSLSMPEGTLPALSEGRRGNIELALALILNGQKTDMAFTAGASLEDKGVGAWLDSLSLKIPGISLTGNVSTRIPMLVKQEEAALPSRAESENPLSGLDIPPVNGGLVLDVDSWDVLHTFVPALALKGSLKTELSFVHDAESGQRAGIVLHSDTLAMQQSGEELFRAGSINFVAETRGISSTPSCKINLNVDSAAAQGIKLSQVAAQVEGSPFGLLNFALSTRGDIVTRIAGSFRPGKIHFSGLEVRYPKFHAGIKSLRDTVITYSDTSVRISGLDVKLEPGGKLSLNGEVGGSVCSADGRLSGVSLAAYRSLLPSLPEGNIDIDFRLSGTPQKPEGGLTAKVARLSHPGVPLAPLNLILKANVGQDGKGSRLAAELILPRETLDALGATSSSITARLPLASADGGIPLPDKKGNIEAKVQFRGTLDKWWKLAAQADRDLSGRFQLDALAGGTMENPEVEGHVRLGDCRFRDIELGLLVDKIFFQADLPHMKIHDMLSRKATFSLKASDGRKGLISIDGNAALSGHEIAVKGKIHSFAPLHRRDIKAQLSGDIAVTGPSQSPRITGTVCIDNGELDLEKLDIPSSVETLDLEEGLRSQVLARIGKKDRTNAIPESSSTVSAGQTGKRGPGAADNFNIRIQMSEPFRVAGFGFESLWKANLLVSGKLASPNLTGAIQSVRGQMDLFNRRFKLATGDVAFSGGLEPILDIKLTNQAADIEAAVNVKGSPRKIDFSLSSTPELPQEEIIARMLFGKSSSELTQYELMQLGLTVARMATLGKGGKGITDVARGALGVDVLNVTQSSDGSARLEMGKYLRDNLYVGVEKEAGGEGETSAVIQMELTPRTSATVKTGGSNTSAGIKWKMDY